MTDPLLEHHKPDGGIKIKLDLLHDDVKDMKGVLKELTTAINRLAIVEERQSQAGEAMGRAFKGLDQVRDRLSDLEALAVSSRQTNDWAGKALWAAAAASAVYIGKKVGLL